MKPEIRPFQSVLGAVQGAAFVFQPYATNSPSGWALVDGSFLPPGMAMDAVTGAHTGPMLYPGVYRWAVTAHNFDGISDPMEFSMGVVEGKVFLPYDITEMDIDIPSRTAKLTLPALLDGYKSANTQRPLPIMFAKRGDIILLRIRFWRGDVLVDVPATSVKFVVKNIEPESVLVESSHWARTAVPEQSDVFYTLRIPFDKPALRSALSDEETDDATFFVGLAEVTWEFNNSTPPVLGPSALCRSTTQTFGVVLPRDLYDEEA